MAKKKKKKPKKQTDKKTTPNWLKKLDSKYTNDLYMANTGCISII